MGTNVKVKCRAHNSIVVLRGDGKFKHVANALTCDSVQFDVITTERVDMIKAKEVLSVGTNYSTVSAPVRVRREAR